VEGVDEGIPMTISKIGIGSLTPFFRFPDLGALRSMGRQLELQDTIPMGPLPHGGLPCGIIENVESVLVSSKRRDNRCVGSILQDTQS
jgi:hypothetical protein